jgi:hypothetical protein
MRRFVLVLLGVLIAAAVLGTSTARAQALRTNPGFSSRSIAANDDGSSGQEAIGFTLNFFGKLRSAAWVNNNGNLTFDGPLPTFTPFGLLRTQREIIAPFFADVDTRPAGSRLVTFGQDSINGRRAFGANYVDVGYYNQHDDKLNSFQVVLIERADTGEANFDIEFNYGTIKWETGDASGGRNGFGGVPAVVGWSNGSNEAFELPGSMVSGAFLDGGARALVRRTISGSVVTSSSGSAGTLGRLVFRARDGIISPGLRISNGVVAPDATVGAGYSTALTATGSDGPFRWTLTPDVAMPPGLSFNANGTLSGVPTTAGTFSYTLSVTANTEDGEVTVYERGSITVRPPVLSIVTACPLEDAMVGRPYSVTLRTSGTSGGVSWRVEDPYTLPPGVTLSASGRLGGTPLAAGTYIMNLLARSTASDGSEQAQSRCRLNVAPAFLQLSAGCKLRATAGVPFWQILAAEGGAGPYQFDLVGQLPVGVALTSRGLLSGTPAAGGAYPFDVAVTDALGVQSLENCWLSVYEPAFSVAGACPLPGGVTGLGYSASLPRGYTWSISSGALPAGLALSPDGEIRGTPMTAGAARFGLIATDSEGSQAGVACSLPIHRGPLSVSGCPLPNAAPGASYSAGLNALGGSAPYFFSLGGSLPEGLELSTDGVVHGAPAASGSYRFTVLLREAGGQTVSQACWLTVSRPALEIASACPLPEAKLGEAYAAQVRASGGAAPYRFEFGGYLPDGLQATSDGWLRGTPRALGGRSFLIRVTDAENRAVEATCSVNVGVPRAPEVRLGPLPSVVAAAATNVAVSVELAEPYTQAVEGEVELLIQPDTRSSEAAGNQADPRLRFASGQTTAKFAIPAGSTRVSLALNSTGTVASTVYVQARNLRVGEARLSQYPAARSFRIPRTAPAVTAACYAQIPDGLELRVNGLSTTRELTRAEVTIGARSFNTDLTGISAGYYSSAETIRFGGAFSLRLPYEIQIAPNTPIGPVTMLLENTAGAAPVQTLGVCQ